MTPAPHAPALPPTYCRLLTPADLRGVLALQAACYGEGYLEPLAAFAAKLAASPRTCWLAERAGLPLAYLFALPVDEASFPALHATACQAPAQPRWLYLHDMAVSPEARGAGLATTLLGLARTEALRQGLGELALIAVQGSVPYWARQGFALTEPPTEALRLKLASFGEDARFMCAPAHTPG